MNTKILCAVILFAVARAFAADAPEPFQPFDAAPFAASIVEKNGLVWEDPREIHEVRVEFQSPPPAKVRLEYWGSRWPEQHLPKDREPGGGDVGWMELGNWHVGGWRIADADCKVNGTTAVFTFRPVNAKEFKKVKDYDAKFRFTYKIRVVGDKDLPEIKRIVAFTDSVTVSREVRLAWKTQPGEEPKVTVFNGQLDRIDGEPKSTRVSIICVTNLDPNTFDRTLVSIQTGTNRFTFKVDDLDQGPLLLPQFGVAVTLASDTRSYATIESERKELKTVYDRVSELPEQTWTAAWNGLPAKKSRICFPLGLDGGRQKFRLDTNGVLSFRWGENFIAGRPGRDTGRLAAEKAPVIIHFEVPSTMVDRHLEDDCEPICVSTWQQGKLQIVQTAFATELDGAKIQDAPPPSDAFAVAMLQFDFTNTSSESMEIVLPVRFGGGETVSKLRIDTEGMISNRDLTRGQFVGDGKFSVAADQITFKCTVAAHEIRTLVAKIPYLPLTEASEREALKKLEFKQEHAAIGGYWARKLAQGSKLITPEPVLNNFYQSVAGHLLINSELEPGAERRFARVGSFAYGAYGNESCMMVVDLDRRGYHREAAQCLDGWLHYQGTVSLPGDFKSQEGVLYGAGSYESGGYNQHHGWILWMMAEHFRFTRDEAWLRHAIPGMIAGADWIIRETERTNGRNDLSRGLLPAGSLEDIGDWWNWLSTSCYTWRGLDAAAWALEQAKHPEAARIRGQADAYHKNLLDNFMAASVRSPVVRLRDGTAVPQIPSYVQRRGRSFGWICQTLEGSIHLLITGALDARSQQAEWIVKDYEDNLYLSNQYGYLLDDYDKYWFGRGGMSMQACLLLDVEPYLYRDDVKHALRATFNAIAVSHFADVHMNTEHALPEMGDWRGDHYKSSDEGNACGWLRYLFLREQGNELLIGQAVPREWLRNGQQCGLERGATWFGQTSIRYTGGQDQITAVVDGPTRNAPGHIRLRFRDPGERPITSVTVNGAPWQDFQGEWVKLPGDITKATVVAKFGK